MAVVRYRFDYNILQLEHIKPSFGVFRTIGSYNLINFLFFFSYYLTGGYGGGGYGGGGYGGGGHGMCGFFF